MRIESYHFGKMVVDGKVYDSDLILFPSGPRAGWWRQKGHDLSLVDLDAVLAEKPDLLVIGTGAVGMMKVRKEVLEAIRSAGIEVVADRTKEASRIYNEASATRRVVGAFHLTC